MHYWGSIRVGNKNSEKTKNVACYYAKINKKSYLCKFISLEHININYLDTIS